MRFFKSKAATIGVPGLTPREVKQRLERGDRLEVIDVRQPLAFADAPPKVVGAVRIPPEDLPERFAELPRDRALVFYCTCPAEETSTSAAKFVQSKGFSDVFVLKGGYTAWAAARYPLEAVSTQ